LESYERLLSYTKSAVTRNYSEKSINSILEHVSNSADMEFLEKFYTKTLASLEEAKNEVRK
jgi:COP9 signalosome complex subunit 2